MLINERSNYKIVLNEIIMRLLLYLKKAIFRDLYIKVSLYAIKQMLSQYLKVINYEIKSCIKSFTAIIRLSYTHVIK